MHRDIECFVSVLEPGFRDSCHEIGCRSIFRYVLPSNFILSSVPDVVGPKFSLRLGTRMMSLEDRFFSTSFISALFLWTLKAYRLSRGRRVDPYKGD